MKNIIYIALFILGTSTFSQSPNWVVNENDFEYTMSFLSFLTIDGTTLASTNDKVAAFVNGECRGVTNLIYVANRDRYYAYLSVFSNQNGETVEFKIYDSTNNQIKDIQKTTTFKINEHYGDLLQAFSLANPALQSNAEIDSFNFIDIEENDVIINDGIITVNLDYGINVSALVAEYSLSSGAKLFLNSAPQVSGVSTNNFSSLLNFSVLSEDESVLKQWSISVNISTGTAKYFKKDAVCYAGGEIKVLFTANNVEVKLLKDNAPYASQIVTNGEVKFTNLDMGNYKITVSASSKEIVVNLKE